MAEQTLREKTAKGLFWGGISNGVQQVLALGFGVYLARVLNAEDYGLVGMLAIFSGIASSIINSGFTVALTNKQDATHKDYNAAFWFMFFMGLALYVLLFFCAPLIAQFYDRPELTGLSRVLFISFFLAGIGGVPFTVMFKKLMVREQAKIDIFSLLLSGVIGVIMAMNGFAYWALAIQSLVYVGMSSLLKFVISPWRPTFEFDFRPLKGMLSFSVKVFLTNIFTQVNNNIFSVLLGKLYNATQVGYYSQGYKWMGMGSTVLNGMINSVAQPVLVSVREDIDRQRNIFRKMVRFGAFVSFPCMLGLAFIAKDFIFILLGEKWLPAVPFLQLFCIWGAFAYLLLLYNLLLISHDRSDIYLNGTIVMGISQLCILLALAKYEVLTMVIGYVCFNILSLVGWHYYVRKYIKFEYLSLLKDLMPFLLLTLFSMAIGWLLLSRVVENLFLCLVAKILIMALIYLGGLWIFKAKILRESISFIFKRS